MNDAIQTQLRDLIARQGQALCLSAEKCKAALTELCGQHPAEQYVLSSIVELGLLQRILDLKRAGDWPELEREMTARLQEERALQPEAARWGLETWALALGKIREEQMSSRMSEELGAFEFKTVDRRLVAGLLTGGLYGGLLWALGWMVSWGLRGLGQGALVGAAIGALQGMREVALSPWLVLAGALGGASGFLLFQGAELQAVAPWTGAAAWLLAGALARAVRLHLHRDAEMTTPHGAIVSGFIGPAVGWPTAGLLTAFATAQLDAPWSWCLVGLVTGALSGFLEGSRRGGSVAVVQAIVAAAGGGLFGLSAGLVGEQAAPFAWVIAAAVLWAVSQTIYPAVGRHRDAVDCVTFAPGSHIVISASRDGTVGLWQIDEGRLLGSVRQHAGPIQAVVFSSDGMTCASGGVDAKVRLVEGIHGRETLCLEGHTGPVRAVAFSPADSKLASGSADGTVRIWDVEHGSEIHCLRGHTGPVTSVLFDRSGDVVSAGEDGAIRAWDIGTGMEQSRLDTGSPVHGLVFIDGDRHIVAAADDGLRLWNATNKERLREFSGHTGAVHCVAVDRESRRLLSGGADGTVRLWDVDSGAELLCLRGHHGVVRGVAVSADALVGVSGGEDGAVRVFRLPSTEPRVEAEK